MSPDTFEEIIKKLKGRTKEVTLHLLGEPLMHQNLSEILGVAVFHEMPVMIVTNGTLLTLKANVLLESLAVRQINISLQSFSDNFPEQDPTTYAKRIFDFCSKATIARPEMYVNLRLWDLDRDKGKQEENDIQEKTLRLVFSEVFGFDFNTRPSQWPRKKSTRISGKVYAHFDSRFDWPDSNGSLSSKKNSQGTCKALTGHVGIHVDGTVVPCCLDHNQKMPLGSILTSSIDEILSAPRAVAMKEGFKKGKLIEPMCQTCGFVKRFKKSTAEAVNEASKH